VPVLGDDPSVNSAPAPLLDESSDRLPRGMINVGADTRRRLAQILDLFGEASQLISNDVGNVKTHLLRSGRRSRLS